MSRDPDERFGDILAAIERCLQYRAHLAASDESIEATAVSPETPWASIAGLRNIVVHEYFRVDWGIVEDILDNELAPLANTIRRHVSP